MTKAALYATEADRRRTYWQRLKDNPEVLVATFVTFASLFAGIDRGVWFVVTFSTCFVGGWCWRLVQHRLFTTTYKESDHDHRG